MTYEAHITMAFPRMVHVENDKLTEDDEAHARVRVTALVALWKDLAHYHGWKTSAIDGDPVLGTGVHFYFTAHDKEAERLLRRMTEMRYALAAATGLAPVREKIEHVIYDTKTGTDWRLKLPTE